MTQKIIKTGNSLAVTIPAFFVKTLGLRAGDLVKTKSEVDRGRLVFTFSGIRQLTLSADFLKSTKEHLKT